MKYARPPRLKAEPMAGRLRCDFVNFTGQGGGKRQPPAHRGLRPGGRSEVGSRRSPRLNDSANAEFNRAGRAGWVKRADGVKRLKYQTTRWVLAEVF